MSRTALFLALAALWVFISFPVFQGRLGHHDIAFTPQRIISLAEGLNTAFPVYLYPGFSFDYGYPTGVFYPDKFLYPFAWLVHHEWLTYIQALQLYVLCRNAAVILISFYSFHHIFQSRWIALFGCVLYSSSMYHLSNIYIRLALGEFTAMVFLPLLAAGICDLRRSRTKSCIFLLAVGYTGLISSHVITTLLATCCLALYALIEWRVLLAKNIGLTARAACVTLLCNIGFVVPFLSWMEIIYGRSLGNAAFFAPPNTFQNRGLYFWQLPSVINPLSHVGVGVALLSALVAGTALLLCMHIVNRRSIQTNTQNIVQNESLRHIIIILLLATLTLILTTRYFPWRALGEYAPVLWNALGGNIQFPWRWHTCSTLLLTLFSMQSLAYLNSKVLKTAGSTPIKLPLVTTLCASTILLLSLSQGGIFIIRILHKMPTAKVLDNNIKRPIRDDRIYALKGTRHPKANERITVPSNKKTVSISKTSRSGFTFTLHAKNTNRKEPGWLDFPVWNYPGFKAISGKGDKLGVADGDNRRVRVYLPPRFNDTLTLRWAAPWHWRVAHIVSWISMAALLLFAFTPLPGSLALTFPRLCGFSPHRSAPW